MPARSGPNVVCAEAFSPLAGPEASSPVAGERLGVACAVAAVASGDAGESAGSVATAAVVVRAVGSSDRGGSPATAPGAPWGRDPGAAAGCRSHHGIYDSQPRWPAASA